MIGLDWRRPKFSEPKSNLENCKTKNLKKFNVDYKHFGSKILTSIYKNLETIHFATDFVSNLF